MCSIRNGGNDQCKVTQPTTNTSFTSILRKEGIRHREGWIDAHVYRVVYKVYQHSLQRVLLGVHQKSYTSSKYFRCCCRTSWGTSSTSYCVLNPTHTYQSSNAVSCRQIFHCQHRTPWPRCRHCGHGRLRRHQRCSRHSGHWYRMAPASQDAVRTYGPVYCWPESTMLAGVSH
jgi:hypothetical protein